MKEKVLITGGGGFIGSHMARKLYDQGYFVRLCDIKYDNYIKVQHYDDKETLDLRVPKNCYLVTAGMDWVFNFAALMGGIGFITSVGADVMHDNALINVNMLEAAKYHKVKKFLFSSSACIYPTFKQLKPEVKGLNEIDAYPADPDNFYGWEKLFTEKVCEAYQRDYGMDIRITRFHNIYGPEGTWKGGREKSPAALCRKVAEAKNIESISIWGDGKQTRSYCYIDDCLEGTMKLMQSNYDKPMNIGSERLVSIDQLADMIIKISGKKLGKKYDLRAAQGVRGRNADISLARRVLHWEPKVSLEEGLHKTYSWIEKQVEAEK
jgi:nucleoside-diphosphate-sugar epimerase